MSNTTYGCQFANAYLASIPSELKVVVGNNKEQVVGFVGELESESSVSYAFSELVHISPRYEFIDLRLISASEKIDAAEVALVEEQLQVASNKNTSEDVNEELSETGIISPEEPSLNIEEVQDEAKGGDSNQSLKGKRGRKKSNS